MKKLNKIENNNTVTEIIPADLRAAHGSYENLVEVKQTLLENGEELARQRDAIAASLEAAEKAESSLETALDETKAKLDNEIAARRTEFRLAMIDGVPEFDGILEAVKLNTAFNPSNALGIIGALFQPVRTLRVLTEAEKALVNMLPAGTSLPENFYTLQVPIADIKAAIECLASLLPKCKAKAPRLAADGTPKTTAPWGWVDSIMSRVATAKRNGLVKFAVGDKLTRVTLARGISHINPQIDAEYNALVLDCKAHKALLKPQKA